MIEKSGIGKFGKCNVQFPDLLISKFEN